jgi:hypothetical protein
MKTTLPLRTPRHQRGATLIIAMVFLLIFAVMAAAAMRSSMSSVQSISNMQWRAEATAAANDVVTRVVNDVNFKDDPVSAIPLPAAQDTATTPYAVDINGDGVPDIKVSFPVTTIAGVTKAGPRCVRYHKMATATLDPTIAANAGCFGSSSSDPSGLEVAAASGSGGTSMAAPNPFCVASEWVLPVRAVDVVTNTTVDIQQGIGLTMDESTASDECKG